MIGMVSAKCFLALACISTSLMVSSCDDKLDQAHKRLQKILQYKVENCGLLSTPEARAECIDNAVNTTNEAHDKLTELWTITVTEEWQTDEEFKREMKRKILDLADGPIRDLLLELVDRMFDGEDSDAEIEGSATITDPPAITDPNIITALSMAPKSITGGPTPIRLLTKQLLINADTSINVLGEVIEGQLAGSIIVRVGEGQVGPRQIQVIGGSLTFSSSHSVLGGTPIQYKVRNNSSSRMVVGLNGETVLTLDANGSAHPLSFTHDENPIFEVPMTEITHNNFNISVSTSYGYLHAWEPWPVSDFNHDNLYDNNDITAFAQALSISVPRTDLNYDNNFDTDDFDLYMEYFTEDESRWLYQSNRFSNN